MTEKLSADIHSALQGFVNISPVVMQDYPDAHNVTFDVDSQHFDIAPHGCETKEEAEWMRSMFLKALDKVIQRHLASPSWIPCSERLPPIGEEVQCYVPSALPDRNPVRGLVRLLKHEDGDAYYWNTSCYGNHHIAEAVTYWAPMLPSPPDTKEKGL